MAKYEQSVTPAASNEPEASLPLNINGRFFTVMKTDHLLYEAVEVELFNGIAVGIKRLSRAPDLAVSSVGICARELWQVLRNQSKNQVLPDV